MSWITGFRRAQTVDRLIGVAEHFANPLVSVLEWAMHAPGCDHDARAMGNAIQILVVLRPDWIEGGLHFLRLRGPEGEQVEHVHAAIAPRFRKTDAASD